MGKAGRKKYNKNKTKLPRSSYVADLKNPNRNWAVLSKKIGVGVARKSPTPKDSNTPTPDEEGTIAKDGVKVTSKSLLPEGAYTTQVLPEAIEAIPGGALAIDCEMVEVEGGKSAVAEVAICDTKFNVVYHTYVVPEDPITDFRTKISGVTEENLKEGIPFKQAQDHVFRILHRRVVVGHDVKKDFHVLSIKHSRSKTRDTARFQPFLTSKRKPRKLSELALEFLGKEIQVPGRPHSPVEDARAAMALFLKYRSEWKRTLRRRAPAHATTIDGKNREERLAMAEFSVE